MKKSILLLLILVLLFPMTACSSNTKEPEETNTGGNKPEENKDDKYTLVDTSKFDENKYDGTLYFLGHKWAHPWLAGDLLDWDLEVKFASEGDGITNARTGNVVSKDGNTVYFEGGFRNFEKLKRSVYECNFHYVEFNFGRNATYIGSIDVDSEDEVTIDRILQDMGNPTEVDVYGYNDGFMRYRYRYQSDDTKHYIITYGFEKEDEEWKLEYYEMKFGVTDKK